MNIKKRNARNIKIVNYLLEDHTLFDSAVHFDLSVNQIYRVNKQYKIMVAEAVGAGLSVEEAAIKYEVSPAFIEDAVKEFSTGKLAQAEGMQI